MTLLVLLRQLDLLSPVLLPSLPSPIKVHCEGDLEIQLKSEQNGRSSCEGIEVVEGVTRW